MFSARLAEDEMDLRSFVSSVDDSIPREPGTAVFLTSNRENVPHAMLHRLNHCKALHERLVLVSGGALPVIVTADIEGAIGLTFVPTGRFLRERPRRADAGRVSLHLANVESRRGSSLAACGEDAAIRSGFVLSWHQSDPRSEPGRSCCDRRCIPVTLLPQGLPQGTR